MRYENLLGTFEQKSVVYDSEWGIVTEDIISVDYSAKESYKPENAPIKGDHFTPLAYYHFSIDRSASACYFDQFEFQNYKRGFGSCVVTSGIPFGLTLGGPYVSSNTLNRAQTECLVKLGEGKMNFGNTIGELNKTLQGVSSLATDLARALVAIKRRDVKELKRIFKTVKESPAKSLSSRWLQYQLGVKPLVSDLQGAAELHDKGIEDNLLKGSKMLINAVRSIDSSDEYETVDIRESYKSSIRVKYVASIDNSSTHAMQKLGLINPFTVAYELTPYSWVVDYVVPIGAFISALSAPVGLSFEYGFYTIKGSGSAERDFHVSGWNHDFGTHTAKATWTGFKRVPISAFPIPSLYYKSPFTVGHTANLIALAYVLQNK